MTAKKKPRRGRPPKPYDGTRPLDNLFHERFLQEYIVEPDNPARAYRRVYTKVATDLAARSAAARLLTGANVRLRLRHLLEQHNRRYRLNADKVIRELTYIATADPADVYDFTAPRKADGFVALRDPRTLPPEVRRAISSITSTPVVVNGRTRYKVQVKFHDKNAAADKLLRCCGMYRELGELDAFLNTLPPALREAFRRRIAAEQQAAAGPGPAETPGREPLAVEAAGGPGPAVQTDGADPGPVAAGVPDVPGEEKSPAVLPAGGEEYDVGGIDLSRLFDDP